MQTENLLPIMAEAKALRVRELHCWLLSYVVLVTSSTDCRSGAGFRAFESGQLWLLSPRVQLSQLLLRIRGAENSPVAIRAAGLHTMTSLSRVAQSRAAGRHTVVPRYRDKEHKVLWLLITHTHIHGMCITFKHILLHYLSDTHNVKLSPQFIQTFYGNI